MRVAPHVENEVRWRMTEPMRNALDGRAPA